MTRLVVLVAFAVVVSAVTGCAGDEGSDGPVAAVDVLSPQPDPLGLFELLGTTRDDRVVARALAAAAGDCMERQGFSGPLAPLAQPASASRLSIELALIFGIDADSSAEALGLASTFDAYNDEIGAPPLEPPGSESEAWQLAFAGREAPVDFPTADGGALGISPDGCQAAAYVEVFGDLGGVRYEFLAAEMRNRIVELAYADPALAGPVEQWRSCMRDEGWEADSPLAVYRQLEDRFSPGSEAFDGLDAATRAELDATAALKSCDVVSGLHSAGWGMVGEVVDDVTEDYAAQIESYQQAVIRGLEILGES